MPLQKILSPALPRDFAGRDLGRQALLVLGLLAALSLPACLFDPAPLEDIQCSSDNDCDGGDICVAGYCQASEDDTCQSDDQCDDGQFCNGAEVCDPDADGANERGCAPGEAPQADDGIDCTVDICDESTDTVVNTPGPDCQCTTNLDCQILLAADLGVDVETELPQLCVVASCTDQLTCQTDNKPAGESCDDGVECTQDDVCDAEGTCGGAPDNGACDDGAFCNGEEVCTADGCEAGDAPELDDGDDCTVDSCDENNDEIVHELDPACDCQQDLDCIPEDANPCVIYQCVNSTCVEANTPMGTGCNDGIGCTQGDACNGQGACIGQADDTRCNNNAFCDGVEICDPQNEQADAISGCLAGTPVEVDDNRACTVDSCDEENDRVVNDDSACVCEQDQDCVPEDPNPCVVYTCTPQQTCQTTLQEDGFGCDDGLACTVNDQCQRGACLGTPDDGQCDDEAFCTGVEICQPGHPNANEEGCRVQQVPQVDDGIDCTVDACDEDNDVVTHTPNNALCDDGAFCNGEEICVPGAGCDEGEPPVVDDGVDCTDDICDEEGRQVINQPNDGFCDDGLFCNGAEFCDAQSDCRQGLAPQIDDGIECTSDSCDEDNDQIINAPNDGFCDDGLFCSGVETCDPQNGDAQANGCLQGLTPLETFPEQPDCVDVSCDEDNDEVVTDDQACTVCANDGECAGECRQGATCDPENGQADAFGCVFTVLEDGEQCDFACGQEVIVGVCGEGGDCAPLPEGPTGTESCNDGQDNDCDDLTDAEDSDCFQPDTLAISVDATANVGLEQDGALVQLTPTSGGLDATNQGDHLYCVSRIGFYEQDFTQSVTDLMQSGQVSFLDAAGQSVRDPAATTNALFNVETGARGLELCDGNSAIMGPFTFPAIDVDEFTNFNLVYSYQLTVTAGLRAGDMTPGQFMVVSYSTSTTGGQFVPLVSMVPILDDDQLQTHQFVLFASAGFDPLNIRIDIVDLDGNPTGACGFIESVRLEETPRVENNFAIQRAYPQWSFGDFTRDAREDDFSRGGFDVQDFFEPATINGGAHTFSTSSEANSNRFQGGVWNFTGGGLSFGMAVVPPFTQVVDDVDRGAPVLFDFRAAANTTYANAGIIQAGYFVGDDVNVGLANFKKVASILPRDDALITAPAHFISHYDLSAVTQNRYMVVMPEEVKPLAGRRMGFAAANLGDGDVFIDDVNVYHHTHVTTLDNFATVEGPQAPGSAVINLRLRHRRPGQARVQCYWQNTADPGTITVASEPAHITFE